MFISNSSLLFQKEIIDRINKVQEMGLLTGVMDDRGKFIYISEEELLKVKKFIEQRGRVSITELAKSSNELIDLNPVVHVDTRSIVESS
jgi:DDRGK domain-containing protein 1